MLAQIRQDYIYAGLRKQMLVFICIIIFGAVLAGQFFLKPIFTTAKKEKQQATHLLLKSQYNKEIICELPKNHQNINLEQIQEVLYNFAAQENLAITVRCLEPGAAEVNLQGSYPSILAFLRGITQQEQSLAVGALQIEKNKIIKASMTLHWLER